MRWRRQIGPIAAGALAAGSAAAQTPAPEPPPPETAAQWMFSADLRAWYVAPGGRFFLPGGRDIDVEDLNLDSPRLSPYGRIRAERSDWSLAISGAQFHSQRDTISPVTRTIGGIDISTGDALRTDLRYTTADVAVGYRFLQRDLYAPGDPTMRVRFELEASAGVRFDAFDIKLERLAGGTASHDEIFPEAMVGASMGVGLPLDTFLGFQFQLAGNPGVGGQTALVTDLEVIGAWRPLPYVEAQVGYRISAMDLVSGDGADEFQYQGSYAGLFAGLTLRF